MVLFICCSRWTFFPLRVVHLGSSRELEVAIGIDFSQFHTEVDYGPIVEFVKGFVRSKGPRLPTHQGKQMSVHETEQPFGYNKDMTPPRGPETFEGGPERFRGPWS